MTGPDPYAGKMDTFIIGIAAAIYPIALFGQAGTETLGVTGLGKGPYLNIEIPLVEVAVG